MAVGCCKCGYNAHPSALCFDHLPGQEKSEVTKNGYSKKACAGGMFRLYSKSVDELIAEIKKCRVLCVRCHMEETHSTYVITENNAQTIASIEELEMLLKVTPPPNNVAKQVLYCTMTKLLQLT
jgi:hypothetical protein